MDCMCAVLHISHSLLIIQLLLPSHPVFNPVTTARPPVQILLLTVFVICMTAVNFTSRCHVPVCKAAVVWLRHVNVVLLHLWHTAKECR